MLTPSVLIMPLLSQLRSSLEGWHDDVFKWWSDDSWDRGDGKRGTFILIDSSNREMGSKRASILCNMSLVYIHWDTRLITMDTERWPCDTMWCYFACLFVYWFTCYTDFSDFRHGSPPSPPDMFLLSPLSIRNSSPRFASRILRQPTAHRQQHT